MKKNISQLIAILLVIVAAIYSLVMTMQTGRNNKSILLISLFVVWVLSPFAGLIIADSKSKIRSVSLHIFMIIISLGSLIGYGGILTPSGTKPAFIFIFIPFISWIFIGAFILIFRSKQNNE